MTYRGKLRQGVVVFEKVPRLKEGTVVRVQAIVSKPPKRKRGKQLRPVGSWQGESGELARLLAEVQQLRDADVTMERKKWR